MASTLFRHQWWHKKMVANVHERTSIDGWHKRLGHPSTKIVHHLVKKFSLPISLNKVCLHYVLHVLLIKHINNHFVPLVSKVMSHLTLFTWMCGVSLVILPLLDHDITLFLLIIIQNIYGFIQWSQNPVFLIFSRISKILLKLVFRNLSKHFTLTMVVSLSL